MKRFLLTTLCSLLIATSAIASSNVEDYIKRYQDLAIREMKRTGIPASITMAQGMFESQYGESPLAVKANNHFGNLNLENLFYNVTHYCTFFITV